MFHIMQVDETTYTGGTMGKNHPISWYHEYDGGRAWYTAMGHTTESYSDPLFLRHVSGGIRWAAGVSSRWREIARDTNHSVRGCNCSQTMMPSWSLVNRTRPHATEKAVSP